MHATVLIATHNRATLLDERLHSIARMRVSSALQWEVMFVDHTSTDGTRATVERHMPRVPACCATCSNRSGAFECPEYGDLAG